MSKFLSLFACALLVLFVITGSAIAQGPWIMEWYALDMIQGTGGHANSHAVDWLEAIFGQPEALMARRAPNPDITGEYIILGEEGDIAYADGVYTIKSGGADIWGLTWDL